MSNKNKNKEGIVYSTNPDFQFNSSEGESETLAPAKQRLKVFTDKKMRAGKIVTIVSGFVGKEDDLDDLCKLLKTSCGSGGSAKDGEVLIQGDHKDKIVELLKKKNYNVK